MLLDLTIVIPVRNEALNLSHCLEAIGKNWVKKIVVVDSSSTDATQEIAKTFGAEVLNFNWDGKYPKKRNWFLLEHTPRTEWVLFLDADEFLTPAFKNELASCISSNSSFDAYWLRYSIYFMGRPLKGGYPLDKLALFKVGKGLYEKIDENQWSNLDMEIHEHPVIDGKVGRITSKIEHKDFKGIEHYVAKHNEYAWWEAARFLKSQKDPAIRKAWTWKQKLKYKLMETPFTGIAYFIGSYIFLGGFRDGLRGLAFALLKMAYFTQVYCKIRELGKSAS